MQKNDIVISNITDYTADGMGIAKVEGYVLFVPGAVVGDTLRLRVVKCKKNWGYGKIEEVISPSDARIQPQCKVAGKCGGCQYWQMTYEEEKRSKAEKVKSCLMRLGGIETPPMLPIVGAPSLYGYRNKAQYPIRQVNGKPCGGFFAVNSHRVVPCDHCLIQPPIFHEILQFVLRFLEQYHISAYDEQSGKGIVRFLYLRRAAKSGDIMLCLVVGQKMPYIDAFCKALTTAFPEIKGIALQKNKQNSNVIMEGSTETVWGDGYLTDVLCEKTLQISPASFFQVNPAQTERLYNIVKEYAALSAGDTLVDLYCGIGSIGICVSDPSVNLIGIETVPEAVENAVANAANNRLENARFICADASEGTKILLDENIHPDVVIVDPPRKGLDVQTIHAVAQMNPKRVVYVSCDPATLARDIALFAPLGFIATKIQPVDMFPRTSHVESVVCLSRENPNDKRQAFFENARLLQDALGITPLLYGSLGLEYLTGKKLNADDIDILIPKAYIAERWPEFMSVLKKNGYTLIDEHEHTFEKDGIHYAYAQIEELESFASIRMSEIATLNAGNLRFKLLSLQQYLKVYTASAKDGYRVEVREKKDFDKIAFIEKQLQTTENATFPPKRIATKRR